MRAWTEAQARRVVAVAASPTGRRVGLVAGLVLFAGVALRLGTQIHRGRLDQVSIHPALLAAAIGVACAADLALAASWRTALAFGGHAARARDAIGILLVAQVAKYVPGGVLQVASRVGVGARRGVAARSSGAALLAESASLVVAGLLLSTLLVVPWPVWPVLPLAALAIATVPPTRRIAPLRPLVLWHMAALALFGCSAYLLFRASGLPAPGLAHVLGAYTLAWVAGYVVVFAPGGLGVREAVFVWLLSGSVGQSAALSVAVASRVVTLLADVLMGTTGAALLWRRTPHTLPHRASETDQ